MVLRVLLVDSDLASRRELRRHLETMHQVAVVAETDDPAEALVAARAGAEVAIIEIPNGVHEAHAIDCVAQLLRVAPGISVIADGPGNSADLVIRSIQAGAVEFLKRPISRNDVATAIEKVRRLRGIAPAGDKKNGRVISVYALKGGLGATTLATNLAVCLAQQVAESTLLIDLDLHPGATATFLNIRPTYSVRDAFEQTSRLDEAYLRGLLVRHASGLRVLAAPSEIESFRFTPDQIRVGLGVIQSLFEQTVVDLPHDLDSATTAVLEESAEILYLVGLNVPAIRAAGAGLAALRKLGIDQHRVRVIVSRADAREDVNLRQAQEALGVPLFWRIPNDYPAVSSSINEGVPVVLSSPKTVIARNLRKLGESFAHGRGKPEKAKATSLSFASRVWTLSLLGENTELPIGSQG